MTLAIDNTNRLTAFREGFVGIYENIPAEEYHALSAASNSRLAELDRSPMHCRHAIDHPREQTPALLLGAAEHCAVLQPEIFKASYVVAGRCCGIVKKTKQLCGCQGKFFGEDHRWYCGKHEPDALADTGRQVLSHDDCAACHAMHAAVYAHRDAARALASVTHRELSILWRDSFTNQLCKARVDALAPRVAWDIKTTDDASPEGFAWSIRKWGYDRQAAFYLRGLAAVGMARDGFGFIAVEKDAPHAAAVYMLCDEDLAAADAEIFEPGGLLALYADCAETGNWFGYMNKITVLRLPSKRRDATVE